MLNISFVQKPSPAVPTIGDVKKIMIGLVAGGFAFGLAIALLSELVLDRTVKRPIKLENRLSIPLLLSIPYFDRNGHLSLRLDNSSHDWEKVLHENPTSSVVPWKQNHPIRPFCEAIRDRLAFYFQINRVEQNPKLVAVTGLAKGAGTSTLALPPHFRKRARARCSSSMKHWIPKDFTTSFHNSRGADSIISLICRLSSTRAQPRRWPASLTRF
jgi:hypothetical protein